MPAEHEHDPPADELIPLLIDLQDHLDGELSLTSLARRFGCSPFYFHRFFSRSVRETPKRHVDRLRLERAAYRLAITTDTVLQTALSVGYGSHETFSRSFRRRFGCTPREYRNACRKAQVDRLERNRQFRGDGCQLSDVYFVDLPPMTLLAIRRHGAYATCPVPFLNGDDCWDALVDHAQHRAIPFHRLAIAISYDDPTLTPPALQRLDACIPIEAKAAGRGRIRCLPFAGGRYGGIRHTGPFSTIDQAYRNLADGIRRSQRYDFGEEPPIEVFRKIHVGSDPAANLTEIYFPVRPVRRKPTPGHAGGE
jgi:AraC family transcriptional regulator